MTVLCSWSWSRARLGRGGLEPVLALHAVVMLITGLAVAVMQSEGAESMSGLHPKSSGSEEVEVEHS